MTPGLDWRVERVLCFWGWEGAWFVIMPGTLLADLLYAHPAPSTALGQLHDKGRSAPQGGQTTGSNLVAAAGAAPWTKRCLPKPPAPNSILVNPCACSSIGPLLLAPGCRIGSAPCPPARRARGARINCAGSGGLPRSPVGREVHSTFLRPPIVTLTFAPAGRNMAHSLRSFFRAADPNLPHILEVG